MQSFYKKLYYYLYNILIKFPSLGTLISLLLIIVFFTIKSPYFFTIDSLINITNYASDIGIAGSMAALLFIVGEFDFSLGILASFSGAIFFILLKNNYSIWLAIIIVCLIGSAIGVFKGILVSLIKIPSFIATLTTTLMIQGLSIMLTKQNFNGNIVATSSTHKDPYDQYHKYLVGDINAMGYFHINSITVFWILLVLILTIFLRLTKYGNWCVATGGNVEKAKGIGIPVNLIKILVFSFTSTIIAFFGVLQSFRDGSMQANNNLGNETLYMLVAIIGGCSLSGGVGSIVGTFLGALIFSSCYQGIVFANLNNDLFNLFLGVIILITIFINKANDKLLKNFKFS